jgi:predicted transcriptional regulator
MIPQTSELKELVLELLKEYEEIRESLVSPGVSTAKKNSASLVLLSFGLNDYLWRKLKVIKGILKTCRFESMKTEIIYENNLPESDAEHYINLLISKNMIKRVPGTDLALYLMKLGRQFSKI